MENLTPGEAARALSSVAFALSDHPNIESINPPSRIPIEFEKNLIGELREMLHLRPEDNSEKAHTKLFNAVSEAIRDCLIAQNSDAIRARLGGRGELPPKAYEIEIPNDMMEFFSNAGTSRKDISQTIHQATLVQHLTPYDRKESDDIAVSFFCRKIGTINSDNAHTLLVQATRTGARLHVNGAFRVFDNEIGPAENRQPLDILRAFLDIHGINFCFYHSQWMRLCINEVFPTTPPQVAPPPEADRLLPNFWMKAEKHSKTFSPFIGKPSNLSTVLVLITYTIDIERYVGSLNMHGIRAHPAPRSSRHVLYHRG
ncbi:MAG: hypothetical protein ACAI37_25805 [Chthoniobacter sp.]